MSLKIITDSSARTILTNKFKSIILVLSVAVFLTFSAFAIGIANKYKQTTSLNKNQNSPTIIIDAGHGGLTNTID